LGSAYFQIDSDFYIVGGDDANQQCNKEVWNYHIPTDTWTRLNDFPHSEICETTGFAINGKGYVCTGLDSTPTQARDCDTLTWEYDPTTDSWKKMSSYPGSVREEASVMVFDDEAYLGIGYGCSYSLRDPRDWWKFNPAQNTWTHVDTFIGVSLRFTASLVQTLYGGTTFYKISGFSAEISLVVQEYLQ
jgi:N-acetylneuraminic acid mutarotase